MLFIKKLLKFGFQSKSAEVAKERLKILISYQKLKGKDISNENQLKLISNLQEELLIVIKKHLNFESKEIQLKLQHLENSSILELNITFPDLFFNQKN